MTLLYLFFCFFLLQKSHIMHFIFLTFFSFRDCRFIDFKKKYYIFVTIFYPYFIAFQACFLYNYFMFMWHKIITYNIIKIFLYDNYMYFIIAFSIWKGLKIKMSTNFNVDSFIYNFSCKCNRVQKKTFLKNQVITSYIQKRNQLCILVSRKSWFSKIWP